MSIAKNIEISSTSEKSFEDAIRQGISRTCESVDNVCGAWIKEQKVDVKDNQINLFRVDMVLTFMLKE